MAQTEERVVEPNTVIVERSGGGATALIAMLVVVIAAIAAYFLLVNDNRKTDAVTGAAQSVEKAADKAGEAIGGK